MSDTTVAVNDLRTYIERIEKVEEKLDECKTDIKEIYNELKGDGFDAKAVRQVVRLRKMEKSKRDMEQAMLDTYKDALGI